MVSADRHGVVSHAGVGLLREMAEYTGLVEGLTDLAVAVGADAISGIGVLTDREELFGRWPRSSDK